MFAYGGDSMKILVTNDDGARAPGLLALEGAPFGPTPGFAEPDPEAGVVPHAGGAREPPSRVLLTGLAAGGAAAWLVLERAS